VRLLESSAVFLVLRRCKLPNPYPDPGHLTNFQFKAGAADSAGFSA